MRSLRVAGRYGRCVTPASCNEGDDVLDWDDLRFFLAVARHRSLAAAARHLRVTQSTVGRRLAALQTKMGVQLLRRVADGYELTLAGESIHAAVHRVETEMLLIEQTVAGRDIRVEGVVRVAGPQMLTSHLLAPSFATLHMHQPGILIEALPDLHGEPLATNEAEIVVRLRRFEHHDIVVRSIGTVAFGLYGSVDYLARNGHPDLGAGCAGHRLITLLNDQASSAQASWLGAHAGRAHVVLRADSYETQHWSVSCGGGIALLPRFRADLEPMLLRIDLADPAMPIPQAEIWLGVHRGNRDKPRVRLVLDCIAEAVRSRPTVLAP